MLKSDKEDFLLQKKESKGDKKERKRRGEMEKSGRREKIIFSSFHFSLKTKTWDDCMKEAVTPKKKGK